MYRALLISQDWHQSVDANRILNREFEASRLYSRMSNISKLIRYGPGPSKSDPTVPLSVINAGTFHRA